MQPNASQDNGFYNPSNKGYIEPERDFDASPVAPDEVAEWEASEYIQHDKGSGWLILVILVAVVLIGLAVFFKQWTFAVLLVVMAVAFGYFGFRKPRIVRYKINQNGVTINEKQYAFKDFRAFGLHEEGAFYSIILIPVKRLAPAVNLYFGNDQAGAILNIVGGHLPEQKIPQDPFDQIMRRLHF